MSLRPGTTAGISKWNGVESLWVKDSLGNEVTVEKFVESYESARRYLLHKYGSDGMSRFASKRCAFR